MIGTNGLVQVTLELFVDYCRGDSVRQIIRTRVEMSIDQFNVDIWDLQ